MKNSGPPKTLHFYLKTAQAAAALLLLILCATSVTSPAQEEPAPEKPIPAISAQEPIGIFIFTNVRFKRGELNEYFDVMEGDFFSRERDTLTNAMQSLLYFTLDRATELDVIDPLSYKRMNNKARVEIFRTERKTETEKKLDKAGLEKYAALLDFRYVLVGDLLKMKTWKMEGLDEGCEMELAFAVYDSNEREFIRSEKFDVNAKVPAGRRLPSRRLRGLDSNAAAFARSPHGYCFLDIAEQFVDSLLAKEKLPDAEEKH
ncbi:MAG: hypothetical protein ABIH66_05620 [bacterium]